MPDFVSVPQHGTNYRVSVTRSESGKATAVFLHGLQSNKTAFGIWKDRTIALGFSFLAIDCIGFGESDKPREFSYDLRDQASIVADAIRQTCAGPIMLIGHSQGGMIGTLLLEKELDIAGFVNMEGNFVLADCGASLPASEKTEEDFSRNYYPALLRELKSSDDPNERRRAEWLSATPDYAFLRTSRSIVQLSRSEELITTFATSTVRKLFIYGDKNRRKKDVIPASVPTAEIPHAGHFMFMDNPESTWEQVQTFLTGR